MADELLSAAIGAGVTALSCIVAWRSREQKLRDANARTAQQLMDHVAECDRRYKDMSDKQAERHAQNQAELRAVVETNRRMEDKLDSFIRTFVRTGGL